MVCTAEGWQLAWAFDCSSGFEIVQEAELGGVASELGPVARVKGHETWEPMAGRRRANMECTASLTDKSESGGRWKGAGAETKGACGIRNGIGIGIWVSRGLC